MRFEKKLNRKEKRANKFDRIESSPSHNQNENGYVVKAPTAMNKAQQQYLNSIYANIITFGTAIPAKYRPAADFQVFCPTIKNNGAAVTQPGLVYVPNSSGTINIYRDPAAPAFTNGATAGIDSSCAVSWTI